MGSSQSSQAKQTNEVLNESITNMVSRSVNSASARNANANKFTIKIGEKGSVTNCNLKLGQKIQAKQAVKVMAKYASKADLQTQLTTALQNSAEQKSKSEQQSLATTIGVQNSKTEINQKIKNIVNTSITNEVFNTVNGFLDNVNDGTLEIMGKWDCAATGGTIDITQDIVSDQVVELLSDAIISNVVGTTTDSTAAAASTQASESLQTGMISDLGKALMGPIGIILIIVLALGGIAFAFRKSIGSFLSGAVKLTPMGMVADSIAKDTSEAINKFGRKFGFKKIRRR
jgi:hypothetical protein